MTVPLALCSVALLLVSALWLAGYKQIARHREERYRQLAERAAQAAERRAKLEGKDGAE